MRSILVTASLAATASLPPARNSRENRWHGPQATKNRHHKLTQPRQPELMWQQQPDYAQYKEKLNGESWLVTRQEGMLLQISPIHQLNMFSSFWWATTARQLITSAIDSGVVCSSGANSSTTPSNQ